MAHTGLAGYGMSRVEGFSQCVNLLSLHFLSSSSTGSEDLTIKKKEPIKFTQPAFREVSRGDDKHEDWKRVSFVILHFCTALNRLGFILWSGLSAVRSKQGNARRTVVSKHGAIWVLILNAMDKDVEIQTKHGVPHSSLNFCST